MKNQTRIAGCDYWGTYNGYDVYRCFSKKPPTGWAKIVFAVGNDLYMNGVWIGYVDNNGVVTSWAPEKALEKKSSSSGVAVVFDKTKTVDISKCADDILAGSWKRSVEDLVGEKFSGVIKYSE